MTSTSDLGEGQVVRIRCRYCEGLFEEVDSRCSGWDVQL